MTERAASDRKADFEGRRARFRQYETDEAIDGYLQRLEREWPEREEVAEHIAHRLASLPDITPSVLELCCGPGRLAQTLFKRLPTMRYTGIDLSPPFLAYAQRHLTPYAERLTLHEVDLRDPQWPQLITAGVATPVAHSSMHARDGRDGGQFHAIVSMQSLHDVGDEDAIVAVYTKARNLLLPGGFLLNADLVIAAGQELPKNPGRRSIPRHLELLAAAGYVSPRCTLARGNFGCVVGWQAV